MGRDGRRRLHVVDGAALVGDRLSDRLGVARRELCVERRFSGTDPIHHVSQRQLHHLRFLDEPPKLQQLVRAERGARQFERQSIVRGYLRR